MWLTFGVNVVYFFVNEYRIGVCLGRSDLGLGLWRGMWISGKWLGICWWEGLWKSWNDGVGVEIWGVERVLVLGREDVLGVRFGGS